MPVIEVVTGPNEVEVAVPKFVTFISLVTLIPRSLSVEVDKSNFPLSTVLIPPTVTRFFTSVVPSTTDLVGRFLVLGLRMNSAAVAVMILPSPV